MLVNTWLFAYAPRIEGANFGDQLEAWDMNLNTGLAEQLQQWEDDILSVDPEGGMSVKIGSRQSSLSPPNSPSQGSGAGSLSLGYSNDGRISPFGRKRPLPSNGEIPSMLGFSPLPPSSFSPPSPPPSPSLQSHFSMPPRFYKATQENEFKDAVEKEYHLMQVFQKYDVDGNGRMDPAEFTKLVSDLLVIRDVHLIPTQEKLNEIARVVASLLLDAPTSVRKQFIDIHDFVDAGTKPGKISSFNHYITGGSPQPPQNLKIGDHLFYNAADGASEPGSSIATLWEPVTIIDVQQLYDGPVYTIHFLDKPPLTVERRTLRRQNQVGLLDTLLSAELLRDVYPHKLDKLKLCCSTRPKAVGFITYDEAELDFGLQLIFYKHDLDANGVLDWEEFIDMVRYLFVAQAGGCSAGGGGAVLHFTDTQVESAAHAIASHSAHLSPVFRPLAAIKIHDFLAAAKRQPSPFDETVSVGMPALAQVRQTPYSLAYLQNTVFLSA